MNVLLISPKGSNIYARLGTQLPPLGLAYIAAVCLENGHQVKITDLGLENTALGISEIHWADVVGITADTTRYPEAVEIAKMLKRHGKIVVMGGYHVSFLDEEALNTGVIDYVVRGEGEYVFLDLLNAIKNNSGFSDVEGISYLEKGVYKRNIDAVPPNNLDKMPLPARELLPLEKYQNRLNEMPMANLITSRGCPFNCYFCSSSKFGGLKWRMRSATSIVDEIEYLYKKFNYRAFAFMDDNFTLSPKRVLEFADELEKRNLTDIHWWCFSRVDILVRNEEMVKRMAELGAFMVFLGLESNNEEILGSYNKNIKNDQQTQAIDLLRKYGIRIHGSFIIGDIDETKEMVLNTIKWAKQIGAHITQFSILTPYPGTSLYQEVERDGRFLHKNWEKYDAFHPTVKLNKLTPKETHKLLLKGYKSVYLNPNFIIKRLSGNKNGKKMPKVSFVKKLEIAARPLQLFIKFRQEMQDYN